MSQKLTKEQYLQRAKDYAASRGGQCLSNEYVAAKSKLEWKCNRNHASWLATPDSVISRKSWCNLCYREDQSDITKLSDGLIRAQNKALSHGGKCLSSYYQNARAKMKWECSEGHFWDATYDKVVLQNRWCPHCAKDRAVLNDGYERANKYALSKGGKCLSDPKSIIKPMSYLTWQCGNGHSPWDALFINTVVKGGWCPKCAGRFSPEEYISKAKELAIKKGGVCLSDKYENQNTRLNWHCGNPKHPIFNFPFDTVEKGNSWCNLCKKEMPNPNRYKYIEIAKKHALSINGKCLSETFISKDLKLEWECQVGHRWFANYHNVTGSLKRWCPQCAGQLPPEQFLEKAKKYAITRGGVCLSSEYIPKKKLMFKCKEKNHKPWTANIDIISNNSWCPECVSSNYYKENNMRSILEFLLNTRFPKSYESWNINPKTGKKLEFDGYSKELNIAFEFQGRHHIKDIFKNNSLEDVKFKDTQKKINCINNNVILIEIFDDRKYKNILILVDDIKEKLNEKGICYKNKYEDDDLLRFIYKANATSEKEKRLKMAQEYAISRNGKCLSEAYINYDSPMIWRCDKTEHQPWKANYGILTRKNWCPACALVKIKKPV